MRRRAPWPLLLLLTGCVDVRVGHPESLWLLWLVPATLVFFVYVFRTKARLLKSFVSAEMVVRLTAGISGQRQVFKAILILVGLAASVLALAEIQYGFTWEEIKREGVDIVVALDVSDSMLVEDAESGGQLSRLERAKREVADLLALLEGDRIGLVAFAGTAFVECPLTLDYGAAELFLDAIDTDLIPVKGTDLAQAIRAGLSAFEGGSNSSQAMILITDGEDHSGQALAAAEEAKVEGVRVFTIGIGRDEGAPIPDAGGGFRRDNRGEIVLSRLDEPTLQKIALETGGRYVRSVTGDVDLEQIYSQGIKATLEDQELGSKRRQRWEDRFQWFVALALLVLMLEPLISIRDRQRRRRQAGSAPSLVLLGLVAASAATAQQQPGVDQPLPEASQEAPAPRVKDPFKAYDQGLYDQALQGFTDLQVEYPEDPDIALNLGSSHYQMRNYAESDRAFSRAALASDEILRQEAIYNLGNSAFRQGRLEEAVELYKAALELDPEDEDAKFNLEFVRDEIRRRHEEAQERQDQQQQNDQQQSEQQQEEQQQDQQQEDEQQQEEQQQPSEDQQSQGGQDSDQDGLPDEVEQPGDGVPDAQESASSGGEPQGEPQEGEGLTPEEAERYLQALEEGRPERQLPEGARRRRNKKDW